SCYSLIDYHLLMTSFFNATAPTQIYTLSLHDALPISLRQVRQALDAGRPARGAELSKEERALLRPLFLLTMKPVMYVANIGEQRSEEHTSELQSLAYLVCRLLLEKKKKI